MTNHKFVSGCPDRCTSDHSKTPCQYYKDGDSFGHCGKLESEHEVEHD